jgi:serine protease Do
MSDHRKAMSAGVILAATLVTAFAVLNWPDVVSRATYAIERGQAQAAEERLAVATDLSEAFKHVARVLRPSVVSVSSIRRLQVSGPQGRRFDSQMPEELRRFFGDDDLLDRFFFDIPSAPRGFEQHGLGSGVIVSADGYILTNSHVVQGADEVTVTLSDKRQLTAEIVGTDKATDVAVLKVEASDLHPAKLGDSSTLQVGEWALAVGSPFGLDQTVTAGIISAVGRANVGITDYEDFIQTDAAINPGNSGGPLVNLKGEVIGINTAIASRNGAYQGVGFAIPSEMAQYVMESIISHGKVTRGFLGAYIQPLTQELARSFGFDSTEGVLIGDVSDGGPADKAGLQEGDIVLRFNGDNVTSAPQLRNAVAATAPGTRVTLDIYRNGRRSQVTVEIGQLTAERVDQAQGGRANASSDLGLTVEPLTSQLAERLGVEDSEGGVVVTAVDPTGLAARAGVRPGDIIVSIGGKPIRSLADFRETTDDLDSRAGIRMQVMREGIRQFVFLRSR